MIKEALGVTLCQHALPVKDISEAKPPHQRFRFLRPLLPTLASHKRYRNGMFMLLARLRGFAEAQFRRTNINPPISQGGSIGRE